MNTIPNNIKILFAIAALIFLINCAVLLYTYNSIPESIIVHSYNGGTDGYGDKSYLWVTVALNAVLLLLIAIAINYCEKWMRPTPEMTADERESTIGNARLILAIVAIKIAIVFSIILFK